MEGLIWYVLFITEKRKGGVVLKLVELSYGIGFLLICERRTPLVRLRRLLKNIFFSLVLMCRYVFIFLNSNVHITFSYLIVFLNSLCLS